jgi:regulator of RNase E activity RraA
MLPYANDQELFALLRTQLFTAVVGDVLDRLGYLHQFLPAGIEPLQDDFILAGRAMPVLGADITADNQDSFGSLSDKPFGLMLEALDSLKEGDIYVATGASLRYALWGELMSARAQVLKANGALLDGYVRDCRSIVELGFPTFGRGRYAQDQGPRGKVTDFNVAVEIDGIRIEPGCLLFGDCEGVIVVPKEAEEETIRLSLEKVQMENKVGDAIRAGMSTCEAFAKYGVM